VPRLLYVTTTPAIIRNFLVPYAAHFRGLGWEVHAAARGATDVPAIVDGFDGVHELPLSLSLRDPSNPPAWNDGGSWSYPLGTDNQGRDVLSAILYGARLSLVVGLSAVVIALLLGVTLGLVAGWRGGIIETVIMRVADVQLSFPAILIALLIDGVARSALPRDVQGEIAIYVLIAAIALATWVQYARTVRGMTLVERNKEYILAARVIGVELARVVADRDRELFAFFKRNQCLTAQRLDCLRRERRRLPRRRHAEVADGRARDRVPVRARRCRRARAPERGGLVGREGAVRVRRRAPRLRHGRAAL